jgi:hypothetical protein
MDRIAALEATFDAIDARLDALATDDPPTASRPHARPTNPTGLVLAPGDNATADRLRAELEAKGVKGTFVLAPPQYYDEPLEFRRQVLGATSVDCLCKSIIMENTRIDEEACREDASLVKYWLVIVQYSSPGAKKELLNGCVHARQPSLSKRKVNMRVVAEDVSMELSGFGKNAVSPVALKRPLPIILAESIVTDLDDGSFWLGGGEVDIKLGMSVKEFVAAYDPVVAKLY